jgi:hypothetical protein
MRHTRVLASVFVILTLVAPTVAQDLRPLPVPQRDFDFYARGPFRDGVPRPEATLGYRIGSRETTYWEQDRVVRAIADAAKDRVRIVPYGHSTEGRPLRLVVISSPENMQRLDEIRAANLKLSDPRVTPDAEAARVAASAPVIVWINECIHGNESASFESGMQLIYQLAASDEPKTLEVLRSAVVIVNPVYNADGHERFAVWHNSIAMSDPNHDAIEHNEPWGVFGRYNHYRFDMNRDKLAVSQQESRQEIAEYLRWQPHVYVDQHGQVTQYFFPPVALPINTNTDLAGQEKWLDIFGRGNAAAFDRQGWGYYTRKIFDFFYVGYLDSWAALNGAIGMTYETDGGGWKGLAWARDDDTVVTLRDAVAHHFVTAMATIETSAANREARIRDFHGFRKAAVNEGRTGSMRSVVLVPGSDPGRTAHLVATLRRSGIEVGVAGASFSSKAAHGYGQSGPATPRSFSGGVYVVDLAQPAGRLARAILEPEAVLNQEFVRAELERRKRNNDRGKSTSQEGSEFYDVTAWSLPFAFNVEAYWTEDAAPSGLQPVGEPVDPESGLRPALAPEGRVVGGNGRQGYLFSYETDGAARLALALMREGYRLAVAERQVRAGGRTFPRGTLIARTERNPDSLAPRIRELARETGVEVTAVDSQYADESSTGIGSEDITSLKAPRVLVCAGDAVSLESYGWIWFMLEKEIRYPFTAMDVDSISGTDLSRFDVIVLPDGSSGEYSRRLGEGGIERLKAWANGGGTIVGIGGAASFLASKDVKLTTAQPITADDEKDESAKEEPAGGEAKDAADSAKPADKGASTTAPDAEKGPEPPEPVFVPGAIFRANVDQKYFMSYGYEQPTLPVLVNTDLFLRPSKEGANVVTFGRDMARLSGFVWPNNTEVLLKDSVYLVDEPTGKGHVIVFADDPNFRRIWRGTTRLFLNALIFAPSL